MNDPGRDALFLRIIYVLVGLTLTYAVGGTLVLIFLEPADTVVTRFIASFGTFFIALLGLCTGYLMRNGRNGKS